MASTSHRQSSERQHRRETILYLIVPMIAVGVMVLAGGVIALMLPRRLQVQSLSDWMLTIMVLCPAVLCLFVVCLVLMVAIAGMNKLHSIAAKPLDRLEEVSQTVVEKTTQAADLVNEKTVDVSTRFAFIDRFLSVFDSPSENGDEKHV